MGLLGPAALIDDERGEMPELRLEDDVDEEPDPAASQLPEWATDVTFDKDDFDRVEAEWQSARLSIDTTV